MGVYERWPRNARLPRREFLRALAGSLTLPAVGGLLTACGGGTSATPTPVMSAPSPTAAPTTGSSSNVGTSGGGELVVYSWYQKWIKEDVIPAFEQETGITVKYLGAYASNDEWWAKLQAGESWDVFIPSTSYVIRAMAADLLTPLDLGQIPNYKNLLPEYQNLDYYIKEGKTYAVPFDRVFYALAYRTDVFSSPPDSWAITWDNTYAGQIALHDNAYSRIAYAALLIGDDPLRPTRWDEIRQKLIEQKALVKKYWKDYQNGMELFINKEAVVGQLTDGRVRMAQDLGAPVGWTVPKEGALIFIDTFAIPKTAKNVENAHKFIDFLLRPDIQLKQLRGMRYDAVNAAARQLLAADELKRFEPPAGAKLILGDLAPAEVLQKASEIWNEVKLA